MLFNSHYIALYSFPKQKIYQNDFLRRLKTYSDNMSVLAPGVFKFEQQEIFLRQLYKMIFALLSDIFFGHKQRVHHVSQDDEHHTADHEKPQVWDLCEKKTS